MIRLYRRERNRQNLFRTARFVAVASHHMATEVIKNGAPEGRVQLMPLFPPGMIPDPISPAPRPFSDRILFVSRITALKGWRQLLDAIPIANARLGRLLTLVVAGDGPDREAFEAETRQRKIPAEFLGWVGADEREAEMRKADVLAVPSVWPEPFGLVGIEAGCVGLPAVGFAVGGIPDWLIPGVSGESAPNRPDPRQLADALVRALADDVHWNRLRLGAWETAHQFTPEAHMDRLIPILEAARS
jgi:glycosyltransferase involved in cell wall biosynthesis